MGWKLKHILPDFIRNALGDDDRVAQDSKRLIIMRHGHEMDHDSLVRQVEHSAAEYNRVCPAIPIEAIIYSPTKRTTDTANSLFKAISEGENVQPSIEMQEWLIDHPPEPIPNDELIGHVKGLDDAVSTICLVTHATTGPNIVDLISNTSQDLLAFISRDYAGMMVLDISSDSWEDISTKNTEISLAITQQHTLTSNEMQQALQEHLVTHFGQ